MCVFVRHLAHEMRQPLSGLESIAYYLEMVLQNAEPNVRAQLGRMHHLVQQASWILSDSVHAMRNAAPAPQAMDLNTVVAEFAADGALHDEANFRLTPAADLPRVLVDPSHLRDMLVTTVEFFRHFARSTESIEFVTRRGEGLVELSISSVAEEHNGHLLHRLLDPMAEDEDDDKPLAMGSLRRMVQANGGQFHMDLSPESVLRVDLRFLPA
jgi:light-regulated signal transduction histidine kinase (bacteriophytochrome)